MNTTDKPHAAAIRQLTEQCDQAVQLIDRGQWHHPSRMLCKGSRKWDPLYDGKYRNPSGAHAHATTVLRDRLYQLPRQKRTRVRARLADLLLCPLPLKQDYWDVWRVFALADRYGRSVLGVALTPQLAAYLLTDRQEIYALTLGPLLPHPAPRDISDWFTELQFAGVAPGYLARSFPDGARYCVGDGDLRAWPMSELGGVRVGVWPPGARGPGNWIWFGNAWAAVCWLREVLEILEQSPRSNAVALFYEYAHDRDRFHIVPLDSQLHLAFYFSAEVAAAAPNGAGPARS